MKKNIYISVVFLLNCYFSFSQVFSNSDVTAAGTWNVTLTKTITVSGLSNLNAGVFELVQVNLHLGDDANTRNYGLYRITLSKGATSIELVATGGFANSTVQQIDTKFRFNTYLRRIFEHGSTAEPFDIGYYRSQENFNAFNGIDPNGEWTITIAETSLATGGRFNNVDLVFKAPFTVQDYTTLNSYDNCDSPYCLGTAEIIVASNNGFTNQSGDMYNPNTTACSWNAAQNNSAWFKFRAAQTSVKVTISGITGNLQILAVDGGADNNPCTPNDNTVLGGGCPTSSINDTYSSPQYLNGSTKNNQLNLSGLTVGNYYYFIVDGSGASVSPFYIETTGTSFDCSNCDLDVTLGSNSPVCADGTLNLTCNDGASWSWTGPNGFTSNSQNPILNNVTSLASGIYTVDITDNNGCTDTKSIEVVINSSEIPTFNTPSPVCSGSSLNPLPTTSNNGVNGSWSPPLDNLNTTTYTFTPDVGQCASSATLTITVNNCDFGAYATAVWMDDCTDAGDGKFYNTSGTGVDLINQEPGNTFIKDFGVHVENAATLILRGAEVKTYKNGGTNVCGAKMYYRYYLNSASGGAFTPRNLAFFSDCNTGTSEFINGGGPCAAGQQKWQCVSQPGCDSPFDLTTIAPGDYTLEVYYDLTGDFNSSSQCDDTIILNNGGTNYKANFSIISVPTLSNTNPTTCNGTDGSISISGLTSNEVYSLSYSYSATTVGPTDYTSSATGQIVISNLGIGAYSNFSFVINSCATDLSSSVTLQNPVITPIFSTPNPYCYEATIPSIILPIASNNGITGSWLPAINNTVTTEYTFSPDAGQCATTTDLTVVIKPEITGTINSNPNTVCNASSTICEYTGPIAFINEMMYMPGANFSAGGGDNTNLAFQSLYNNANTGQEWIEIYNPNPCVSLDLGCYILGSDTSSSNSGAFSFPSGTTIPPLGFLTIGAGSNADINLHDFRGTSSLLGSNRWHLENGCGYILLANPSGVIIDALYWSQNNASDLTANTTCGSSFNRNLNIPNQCNPAINPLPKPRDISNIVYVGNFGATAQGSANIGRTISRITDGANTFVISPQLGGTPGNCNGVCTPPFSGASTCNGSATVTITQGSGNYSYLWNDPQAQTTATAADLCAGNYCVTVTDLDTNCTQEFCVTVNDDITSVTPTFSFGTTLSICSGVNVPTLPSTSSNAITGIWSPSIIDNANDGTYTFTPDAGQCGVVTTLTVDVTTEITPTFSFGTTLSICSGGNVPTLPSTSSNAITGTWSPSIVDNANDGTYTFTPDAGQCGIVTTLTVDVTTEITPEFSFGTTLSICSGGIVPTLPSSSSNAITGTWSPSIVDNVNDGAYTFTPDAGQCATATNFTVDVTTEITPEFSFGTTLSICSGGIVPTLPSSSSNAITGTWLPSIVDNANDGTYTFTPDAGQCGTTTIFTVTVTAQTTPIFGFGMSLTACQGVSPQVLLPALSDNEISGTWNPSTIDNAILGPTIYTFTPDNGQCALSTTLTVTVNEKPQFTISGGCDGENYVLTINEQNQNINSVEWFYNNAMIGQGNSIVVENGGTYSAFVTNTDNCNNSADFVVVNNYCSIQKGISINNDGFNDVFELSNLGVKYVQIFNRYGMKVYSKSNYTNEWDGKSDDGEELPDGTYYYVIDRNNGESITGWIYINRAQ